MFNAIKQFFARKPVVEKPVVEKPVVEKPVVEKPVVEKPVLRRNRRTSRPKEPVARTKQEAAPKVQPKVTQSRKPASKKIAKSLDDR